VKLNLTGFMQKAINGRTSEQSRDARSECEYQHHRETLKTCERTFSTHNRGDAFMHSFNSTDRQNFS
jgi:hypothetical protein